MAFKFVVSNRGKAYQVEVDEEKVPEVIGKRIGDTISGDAIGLPGYVLEIRGGTDRDGFPMTTWLHGPGRKRIMLTGPPGFHPEKKKKGLRKRKMVRGDTISEEIAQINVRVLKQGEKPLEELLGKGEEAGKENKE